MKCLPKCYEEAHLRRSHITSSIFHSSLYLYSSWKTFSLQTLLIHIGQTQSFNPSYAVQIFWLYRTEQTLFRKMPINHFQNKHVALTVRHHHHRSSYFAYTYGASMQESSYSFVVYINLIYFHLIYPHCAPHMLS